MGFDGRILNGCQDVLIEGKPSARKTDLTLHGGALAEGCETVLVGMARMPAARVDDRFFCPDSTLLAPHVGGSVVAGATSVLIGGMPAARSEDPTLCVGPLAGPELMAGVGGASGGEASAATTECRTLWERYDAEARELLAPGDDDHRKRNHIINGAYAQLYLDHPEFKWAGLAAYASKQVGCAMDHSTKVMDASARNGALGLPATVTPVGQAQVAFEAARYGMAKYTLESLGDGNRELFLDIYPMHRFYAEHGFERMRDCASERQTPVPAAALDGFAALERYKETGEERHLREHVRALAYHEQVAILQRGIYNDGVMDFILDRNEGNVTDGSSGGLIPRIGYDPHDSRLGEVAKALGTKPADVVMTDACEDPTGKSTIRFKTSPNRNHLHDVDHRMDWIMNDIGGYYFAHEPTSAHRESLERIARTGAKHGASYP
jgi:uncharacterized Zn-binding protein involved in type VI secretion